MFEKGSWKVVSLAVFFALQSSEEELQSSEEEVQPPVFPLNPPLTSCMYTPPGNIYKLINLQKPLNTIEKTTIIATHNHMRQVVSTYSIHVFWATPLRLWSFALVTFVFCSLWEIPMHKQYSLLLNTVNLNL